MTIHSDHTERARLLNDADLAQTIREAEGRAAADDPDLMACQAEAARRGLIRVDPVDADGRWRLVIVHEEKDGKSHALGLSRRLANRYGVEGAGPWGLLTEGEANDLAAAWNADPAEGGRAEVISVYRYEGDPWGESV